MNGFNKTKALKRTGTVLLGLIAYYTITGNHKEEPINERYVLPKEISVTETTLPCELKFKNNSSPTGDTTRTLERIVHTDKIDFSKHFVLRTERYSLIKDDDWMLSRGVGWLSSLPHRLLFWEWGMGLGLDEDRTKAALAMLENNKQIKDITVRINHNEALYDFTRMFKEEKLENRNPWLARATIGLLYSLSGELWAELKRGDYYNPLTQTAVVYSNVEAVTAHEIGHHRDFQRYNTDWIYAITRPLVPVMIYQEVKASLYARDEIMSKKDAWQFNRYLIPALATYLLYGFNKTRRTYKKLTKTK